MRPRAWGCRCVLLGYGYTPVWTSLGGDIFHGKRGELRQRYYEGMEDQLDPHSGWCSAIALFNTRYLGAAIATLALAGIIHTFV